MLYATPERKKFLEEVDEEMDRQDAEDRGRRAQRPAPRRRSDSYERMAMAWNQKLPKRLG